MRCFVFLLLLLSACASAQQPADASRRFTHADSLRGGLRPERTGFDVRHYDLSLTVDPAKRSIAGQNTIRYTVAAPFRRMQLDLFANMNLRSITQNGKKLAYIRDGNAVFVTMVDPQLPGKQMTVTVVYDGQPQEAKNPPWDGGFVWRSSPTGKPWVTVACEGTGASLWWPCKDHLSDEPDSVRITCRVPAGLTCVSNGTLLRSGPVAGLRPGQPALTEFVYATHYPINSYNVTLNITDYETFTDAFQSPDGYKLPLTYFVLPGNVAKARTQFEQVKTMLACYDQYFGPFPFRQDGYKLVETPYWGMEHQTAVAYGNKFRNNAWGFDFIIIHESGHEYFGNSLSVADHAEMWIHESFTTYAEALFVEYTQGADKAVQYLTMQRKNIKNQYPMLGPTGVNADQPDTDIYYKGTWMLHSMRRAVGNDSVWFAALKALTVSKQRSIVGTDEVIGFLSAKTGRNLRHLADQYLKFTALPILEYSLTTGPAPTLRYRWVADVPTFDLPVRVQFGPDRTRTDQSQTIRPGRAWQTLSLPANAAVVIDPASGLFDSQVVTQ
jgi:aminopeptidase N